MAVVVVEEESVPQTTEEGLEVRLHFTPAFVLSLVTVAVTVTAAPPASMVDEPV